MIKYHFEVAVLLEEGREVAYEHVHIFIRTYTFCMIEMNKEKGSAKEVIS